MSLSDVSPGSKNLLAFASRLSVVAIYKDGGGRDLPAPRLFFEAEEVALGVNMGYNAG